MTVRILHGDVITCLRGMPDDSVHMIATSPPYYGLRSYGIPPSVWGGDPHCAHAFGKDGRRRRGGPPGQSAINEGRDRSAQADTAVVNPGAFCEKCHAWRGHFGLEPTYPLYVKHMVLIMREARRVLRSDGVMWLNLGDSYLGNGRGNVGNDTSTLSNGGAYQAEKPYPTPSNRLKQPGLKSKDLMMIPERVAIALQDDGWWVRSRCPWIKRNAMPESANDRPATATEYIFLLAKSETCFYDRFAVQVPSSLEGRNRRNTDWFFESWQGMLQDEDGWPLAFVINPAGFKGAHFATWAPKLVEPMVLAGTSEKGCCPDCAAPWQRIVRKGAELEEWKQACGADANGEYNGQAVKEYEGTGAQNASEVKARILAGMRERVTVGWYPTCGCYGIPELPRYPRRGALSKPIWELACELIDAERGELCAAAVGLPVKPPVVLDIFGGSATTALVAKRHHRDAISIEIGEQYVQMQVERLTGDSPLFNDVVVQVAS